MRYKIQLLTNNILQECPSIALTYEKNTTIKKYLFNVPEQHSRYTRRHSFVYGYGMSVFFTKSNCDAMAGLMRMFLEVNTREGGGNGKDKGFKCFNTKVYFQDGAYRFWGRMKKTMGFRLLPFSFYNVSTGEVLLGLRQYEQNEKLIQLNKMKWIRADYSYDQLHSILGDRPPCNAAQLIEKPTPSSWQYEDKNIKILPFKTASSQYTNYICIPLQKLLSTNKDKLAQFQQKYATELDSKVKERLFRSGSVRFASGEVVNLQSLADGIEEVGSVMILHYKTEHDLQQILQNPQLATHLSHLQSLNQPLSSIIHILQGNGQTLFSQQFSQLRLKFGPVQHIVYNKHCRAYESEEQMRRDMMDMYPHFRVLWQVRLWGAWAVLGDRVAELYRKLVEQGIKERLMKQEQGKSKDKEGSILLYKPRYELVLAPVRNKGYHPIPPTYSIPQQPTSNSQTPSLNVAQQALQQKLLNQTKQSDPSIIFLGTSSMRSINERNVSGIVIKLKNKEEAEEFSVVLDCGDGIHDQFVNHFGGKYWQEIVKVRVMFLTHMHQDHCAGVFNFIARRNAVLRQKVPNPHDPSHKLFLIMPQNMTGWFESYNKNTQNLDEFTHVVVSQSMKNPEVERKIQIIEMEKVSIFGNKPKKDQKKEKEEKERQRAKDMMGVSGLLEQCLASQEIIEDIQNGDKDGGEGKVSEIYEKNLDIFKQFLEEKKITKFYPIPVYHCRQSYGLVLEHRSAAKISFSGDCRPTSAFLRIAKYSTLMIHEATFLHSQKQRAKMNLHSTSAEAIEVAFKSASTMVALTHFSPAQGGTLSVEDPEDIKKVLPNVEMNYIKNHVFKASDHLEFKLSEMYKLPEIVKALGKR